MPDFVTLSCPSCGGKLEITPDIERFACGYCGNEHVVRRGGGIISLIPIAEDIKGIKTGVDKTAAELAISRLKHEINERISVYDFFKRKTLNKMVDKNGRLNPTAFGYLGVVYLFRYGYNLSSYDNSANIEKFNSLSDEDIIFSLTIWTKIWRPKDITKPETVNLYNLLNEVKKLIGERDNSILQKQTQIEKMRQIANS